MAARRLKSRSAVLCAFCHQRVERGAEVDWPPDPRTAKCAACAAGPYGAVASGVGGRSARVEARRLRHEQRERHERLKQARPVFGRLALAVAAEADPGARWENGAVGEERLARLLDALPTDRVRSLHDRALPHKRNIDHIAVTADGVWVIDAKRYKGIVEKRDIGGWRRRTSVCS